MISGVRNRIESAIGESCVVVDQVLRTVVFE